MTLQFMWHRAAEVATELESHLHVAALLVELRQQRALRCRRPESALQLRVWVPKSRQMACS